MSTCPTSVSNLLTVVPLRGDGKSATDHAGKPALYAFAYADRGRQQTYR